MAGRHETTPDARQIDAAEQMLVRLENDGIAVRLNLQGQPGEQPDYVVAAWVLPYVYALRGDRDWRRVPQLTGSRAVSPLAVQAYKLLDSGGDATVSHLKHTLGREVTEGAVIRAITELWQQLRIIPIIAAPGQPARWQLLRNRFQKAIAEGASTSQVTAISVLASIFLQAVIAATMEDVELFLAPLTARSKVREVLRGLVATRQVHTIALGPAPHFYVAGTLPEFAPPSTLYGSTTLSGSSYFDRFDHHESSSARSIYSPPAYVTPAHRGESRTESCPEQKMGQRPAAEAPAERQQESHSHAKPHKPAASGKSATSRPHFSRPAARKQDRKHTSNGRPGQSAGGSRNARHASDSRTSARPGVSRSSASRPSAARPSASRPGASRPGASRPAGKRSSDARTASTPRWSKPASKPASGSRNGNHAAASNGHQASGSGLRRSGGSAASGKPAKSWSGTSAAHNGHANGHANGHKSGLKSAANGHKPAHARTDARSKSRPALKGRKPAYSAGAGASGSKRYGFTSRSKSGPKKRG
ncbi:MAG TPA: hypothetical protein VFU68_01605 [Terracidiphilus sp.]|nr:hypothetical protein [Terracidiphilus sp.]